MAAAAGRQAGGQETIIDQAARPPSTCQNDKLFSSHIQLVSG